MSNIILKCIAYLTKEACYGTTLEPGKGYPALLTGSTDITIEASHRDYVINYKYVQYVCGFCSDLTEMSTFVTKESLIIPSIDGPALVGGGVEIKAFLHNQIAITSLNGKYSILPVRLLDKAPKNQLCLYAYIADSTGLDIHTVKKFIKGTLLTDTDCVLDLAKELGLGFYQVHAIVVYFNKWTGFDKN